jgi:RNA recognition motif-containing protein
VLKTARDRLSHMARTVSETLMTTIYVGNLPFTATEDEVRSLFERYGKVDSVKLINDRETGRPRGFAFVDMGAGEAQHAIQQTNGFQMGGRPLRVNEAQERAPRSKPPGGGGSSSPRRW